mgnify:CR=1 FL=1
MTTGVKVMKTEPVCLCGHARNEHHPFDKKLECMHCDTKTVKFCTCREFKPAKTRHQDGPLRRLRGDLSVLGEKVAVMVVRRSKGRRRSDGGKT